MSFRGLHHMLAVAVGIFLLGIQLQGACGLRRGGKAIAVSDDRRRAESMAVDQVLADVQVDPASPHPGLRPLLRRAADQGRFRRDLLQVADPDPAGARNCPERKRRRYLSDRNRSRGWA